MTDVFNGQGKLKNAYEDILGLLIGRISLQDVTAHIYLELICFCRKILSPILFEENLYVISFFLLLTVNIALLFISHA